MKKISIVTGLLVCITLASFASPGARPAPPLSASPMHHPYVHGHYHRHYHNNYHRHYRGPHYRHDHAHYHHAHYHHGNHRAPHHHYRKPLHPHRVYS
ncbi:MAG TPA: hypothetical protein VII28_02145 [Puia sp.]